LHPADPCYGLAGRELDDCLALDADQSPSPAVADYRAEQARRDRELLEQDAAQAAAQADDVEASPPVDQDDAADYGPPPEDELPPGDEPPYGSDDQPPYESDEPPPDDGNNG
jgi:hypothetical protein